MTRLCPLFSGSDGNSYYIGSANQGILIDCGRTAKQITEALSRRDIEMKNISAIFITHEHTDHVKALKTLASRHNMPVYATAGTILALEEKNLINPKVNISPISFDGIEVGGNYVKPFHISHDCREGVGYVVETSDGRKTAFATDTGIVTAPLKAVIPLSSNPTMMKIC